MLIPNGTLILITDGRKMLFFRNDGDADRPRLVSLERIEEETPPDRALKSDRAGQTLFAGTGRASSYAECDYHRRAEERFARRTAQLLDRAIDGGAFERLIVVADRRTLGALRPCYGKKVQSMLLAEVGKDLVRHPVSDIETILAEG